VGALCHALAAETARDLEALTGLLPLSGSQWYWQMVTVPLPPCDVQEIKRRLYDDYHIEVPIIDWKNRQYIRISFQGYNTPEDAECLKTALAEVLLLERC
jgi:isopenicillin-N epimerase